MRKDMKFIRLIWILAAECIVADGGKRDRRSIGLKDGKAVDIFSERDFARLVAREQKVDPRLPVGKGMTKDVVCVSFDETVDECMALMTTQRLRHLPVCDQNSIVGIISIGDVVKSLIEDKDLLIQNMEEYILGRGFGK